ncbi:Hsp20/alpha crystallin family protein [Cytobacillus sp. Hz8]|uniref:Hsp20/alpha crystallin family protein n=1 Tax=Cytobacillus sp. Hz8 TaxID=3347168 RepID=UPI0035DE332F
MPALHDLLPKSWGKRGQELEEFFEKPWFFNTAFDVDVKETEKLITVQADLPGFKKEEINVELDDYSLRIIATRNVDWEEKNEKYFMQERQYGKVERTIPLPIEVVRSTTNAKYEDGVLTISLEKKHPTLPSRQSITIQ